MNLIVPAIAEAYEYDAQHLVIQAILVYMYTIYTFEYYIYLTSSSTLNANFSTVRG